MTARAAGEPVPMSAFRWMRAAGVALAVVPTAGWATFVRVFGPDQAMLAELGTAFTTLSNVSALAVVVVGSVGLAVVAVGVVSAWRLRQQRPSLRPSLSAWLAVVGLSMVGSPILAHLNTAMMFVGVTLATRPVWWALWNRSSPTPGDASAALVHAARLAVGVNLCAHLVAWLSVFATAWPLGDDMWARIHAERGQAQARAADGRAGGIDFIEMDGGYIAAGRSTGGGLSVHDNQVSDLWLMLAGWMVVPEWAEDPTESESWWIAGIAFVASLVFWSPWLIVWVWLGGAEARRVVAKPREASGDRA